MRKSELRFQARVMAANLDDLSFSLAEVASLFRANTLLHARTPELPKEWDKEAERAATRCRELREWASSNATKSFFDE